jgi:hypothetical protein
MAIIDPKGASAGMGSLACVQQRRHRGDNAAPSGLRKMKLSSASSLQSPWSHAVPIVLASAGLSSWLVTPIILAPIAIEKPWSRRRWTESCPQRAEEWTDLH